MDRKTKGVVEGGGICTTSTNQSKLNGGGIRKRSSVESRVKKRVEELKKSDLEAKTKVIPPEVMLPLEELYQVQIKENKDLRVTLREMEEKDILIDELRKSCYDLAIKYAQAESRIDEIRFGRGMRSQSMQNLNNPAITHFPQLAPININPEVRRHSFRAIEPGQIPKMTYEMTNQPEPSPNSMKDVPDSSRVSKITSKKDQATETEATPSGEDGSDLENLDLNSVKPTNAPNWLEKVQNWKTLDSNKSQDSCEFDSGFRGSERTLKDITAALGSLLPGRSTLQVCQESQTPLPEEKEDPKGVAVTATTTSRSDEDAHLDQLLEEATFIAKRVKRKSQKLAKMLKELEINQ